MRSPAIIIPNTVKYFSAAVVNHVGTVNCHTDRALIKIEKI